MITNKNQAKIMAKYISRGCKCKFNTSIPLHILQIKNWIMKHFNASVKTIVHVKRLQLEAQQKYLWELQLFNGKK